MSLVRSLPSPRRLLPLILAIGVALAVAAAFIVEPPQPISGGGDAATPAVPQPDGGGDLLEPAPAPQSRQAQKSAAPGGGEAATDATALGEAGPALGGGVAADSVAPVAGSEPAELGLKILQEASITLKVRRGTVDDTFADAASLARSLNGYVVSSTLSDDGRRRASGSATITIRVPHDRFDRAVERLREHGRFTRIDVTSQDVTQDYVDAKARLRHDQAVEAQLLKLLGKADSVSDALLVQDRLSAIQQQIEIEKGRINYLDKLTAMSTIELTIVEKGKAIDGDEPGDTEWGFADAFDKAAHRFVGNVNAAIVALGGALPALIVLAVAALAARRYWRRREAGGELVEPAARHEPPAAT